MKCTDVTVALALLAAAPTALHAESRIARFCGPGHVNEVASAEDVRPNPAGFHVTSLGEQVGEGDPRIVLTTSDEFHLCTRTAATPDMDTSKALLLMRERRVKYLFVPAIRRGLAAPS